MDDSEPPDPSTQRLPLYPRPESKQDTFPTSTTPLLPTPQSTPIRTPSPAPTKTSIFSRNRTQKTQNQYSLSPSSTVQAAPIQPPFQSPFPFIAEPAEDHFKSERTLAQLESFFGARIDRKEEERKNEILKKEVMGEQELAKDETTESNTSSSSPISIWLTHLLPTKDENSPQFEEQLQTLSLHCLVR
ncbi:hypothetical protein BLNAU_3244 [Blattamonas nauphoetae]|uniref:Uncharacterized protein n=1 Tax=Blattamonas nauphoetae TaxID=2049346 RepID=A0ABQ9YDI8_9EUKA|nr:hypothetical protein BLNAU_3244 [Blattamonas nauphoetae]